MASPSPDVIRTLAAILMADVADYGRHMAEDEAQTVRTLQARREVFRRQIEARRGRVLDAKGDAIMAAFPSAVDAVAAAAAIQQELAAENEALPAERQMQFRIGINLGDVIEEDETLYGDGVNVAARLESLAEPGGICIARSVHDQVLGKLPLEFTYLGEHQVKTQTVRAYQVVVPEGAEMPHATKWAPSRRWRRPARAAVVVLAIIAAGLLGYYQNWWGESGSDLAFLATVEGLPSLFVLPFNNLSGDPSQDYFVDGITEELITVLAQYRDLAVISRNSSFTYKGRAVDVRTVGQEMGVDFVLEGSVRRSNNRIRLTAQLLSAADGRHLWAENFDRDVSVNDLFGIQDEVAQEVATTIGGPYGHINMTRFRESARRPPEDLASYECVLRVMEYIRLMSPSGHEVGQDCLERVVAAEPRYAAAWAYLAATYLDEYGLYFNPKPDPIERAKEALRNAEEVDETDPIFLRYSTYYLFMVKDPRFFEQARAAAAANPRDAYTLGALGSWLCWAGKWEEGLAMVRRALDMGPIHPPWFYLADGAWAFFQGDYEKSLDYYRKAFIPGWYWSHINLAGVYVGLGRNAEAREQAELVRKTFPGFENVAYAEVRKFQWDEEKVERIIQSLRLAGLDILDET